MKLKHRLPAYSIIEHLCLENDLLEDLIKCVNELNNEFKSVLEVNKGLCGIHHELSKSVYDNFFQIGLTDSTLENKEITLDECEVVHESLHHNGVLSNHKRKQSLVVDATSVMNESTYTVKTEIYKRYSSVFDSIINNFKGKPTRIRLVKLEAGSNVSPHIDYDPSYAVRIIIPIIADPECVNVFWVKNDVEATTFVPGKAYFLNTGYKHAVMNMSKCDRYTFMISINGTEDIDHLIQK
jgi:hypothetical protein